MTSKKRKDFRLLIYCQQLKKQASSLLQTQTKKYNEPLSEELYFYNPNMVNKQSKHHIH